MINKIREIANLASKIVMSNYSSRELINYKSDKSPLTKADMESNSFIIDSLKSHFNYPILSEESPVPFEMRKSWNRFWLVDPLDGTKDFIARNDEYTINITLIDNQRPILGVINIPDLGLDYWAEKDKGAYKNEEKYIINQNEKC